MSRGMGPTGRRGSTAGRRLRRRPGTRGAGGVAAGIFVGAILALCVGPSGLAAQGPAAPQNLAATALSSNKVRLTWSPVSGNIREYRVYRQITGGVVDRTFSVTTSSAIDSVGLAPLSTYQYFVTAVDNQNREGAQSAPVSVSTPPPDLTPPSAPSGLSGTATGPTPPGVDLSWSASSDPETGIRHYRVYRDGTRIDTTRARSYHDAAVQASTPYQYEITALNWEGGESPPSASVSVTTLDDTPPTAPTGLSARAVSYARVDLSWSAASDPESGVARYEIFRDGSNIGSSTTTTFVNTGLQETTTYVYEVLAVNGEGLVGPRSAPASVTTPAAPDTTPPTTPTGLSGSAPAPDRVDLGWSAASDPESGIAGYRVYRDGTRVGSPAGTSFSDTGLQPGTSYQYTVSAVNGEGLEGSKSAPVTVTTPVPADQTPPSAPTGLSGSVGGPDRIDLTWSAASDPESGIAGYRVYRDGTHAGSPTATSFSDTGLQPGTTYAYAVTAVNGAGVEGPASASVSLTTDDATDTSPPTVPGNLEVTAASPTRVDLSWTASSDPESGVATYRVYREGTLLATTASTAYTDTTAVAGTTYSYEVSAVNGAGVESARSAPATVTTPRPTDTVPPAPPTRLRIVP